MSKYYKTVELEQLLRNCLQQEYGLNEVEIVAHQSGMNNITRKIQCGNDTYHLRVYCNHQDERKVAFEHHILFQLLNSSLPILIPKPLHTYLGSTVAKLGDGRLVALYHYIEGTQQVSEALYRSLIEATAHLSAALAQVKQQEQSEYTPYYDLATNYPQFTNEALKLEYQLTDEVLRKLEQLNEMRLRLEQNRELFVSLPHQLIHGDINFSNAVTLHNRIIGLLDFEFVTYDLRAMEIAVVLIEVFKANTHYDPNQWQYYLSLFTHIHPLNETEIQLLPQLIMLRAVDVAFHFITRFSEGIDDVTVLLKIVDESYAVIKRVQHYCF